MKKIYIASPYTIGNQEENVKRQIRASNLLLDLGYNFFAPLLMHYIEKEFPRDYNIWIKIDLEWLALCDGLLRLDGESKGADIEVEYALAKGIPVFYSIRELRQYFLLKPLGIIKANA